MALVLLCAWLVYVRVLVTVCVVAVFAVRGLLDVIMYVMLCSLPWCDSGAEAMVTQAKGPVVPALPTITPMRLRQNLSGLSSNG